MKKNIMIGGFLCIYTLSFSQVGINTSTPNATFDVAANSSSSSRPEGFIAPRLTGAQLKAKDAAYGVPQKGAIIYITEGLTAAETSTKTSNVISSGYFYFNGTEWVRFENVVRAPEMVTAFNAKGDPEPSIVLPSSPQSRLSFPVVNIAADPSIGSWNNTTSQYTVAKKGVYIISTGLKMENVNDFGACSIIIHGGNQVASSGAISSGGTGAAVQLSAMSSMILNPGDVIWIGASRNSNLSGFTAGYRTVNVIFSEIN